MHQIQEQPDAEMLAERFCVNIEGQLFRWPCNVVVPEQIACLGGFDIAQGVLVIDEENNQRQLEPGELVELRPGLEFCKKVRFRRG